MNAYFLLRLKRFSTNCRILGGAQLLVNANGVGLAKVFNFVEFVFFFCKFYACYNYEIFAITSSQCAIKLICPNHYLLRKVRENIFVIKLFIH